MSCLWLAAPTPLCIQLGDLRQQYWNNRLGFRRLSGNDFFQDFQRHVTLVAEHRPPGPDQFLRKPLWAVNDYQNFSKMLDSAGEEIIRGD